MNRTRSHLYVGAAAAMLMLAVIMQGCEISRNDRCFALVGDLADYSEANHMQLPTDWGEFTSWYNKTHEKPRWREADLKTLFSLTWGMRVADLTSNRVDAIQVLDSDLKYLQQPLNEAFYRHAVGLLAGNKEKK